MLLNWNVAGSFGTRQKQSDIATDWSSVQLRKLHVAFGLLKAVHERDNGRGHTTESAVPCDTSL